MVQISGCEDLSVYKDAPSHAEQLEWVMSTKGRKWLHVLFCFSNMQKWSLPEVYVHQGMTGSDGHMTPAYETLPIEVSKKSDQVSVYSNRKTH